MTAAINVTRAPAVLLHQPTGDCRSAYSEDEELEHGGEQRIWFEPVDDQEQYASDGPDREHVNQNLRSDIRSAAAFRPMH